MDEELKKILMQLMEGQTEIKTEIRNVNSKLIKIETVQEEIKTNIFTLAELHKSHSEQNSRAFDNSNKLINEKSDLIETAFTNATKELNQVKDSIEVLTEAVGKHEMDIRILKKRPV